MNQQHNINDPHRCTVPCWKIAAAHYTWEDNPGLSRTSSRSGPSQTSISPTQCSAKRHHKTPAEMCLRDFYKACKGKHRKCTSPVPLTECLLSASCFCSTVINRGHTYHSKGMFHGWKVNSWFDLFQKYWRFDGGGRWGGGLRGLPIEEENDYRDRH